MPRGSIEHVNILKMRKYTILSEQNEPYSDEAKEVFHPYFLLDPFEKSKCPTNHLRHGSKICETFRKILQKTSGLIKSGQFNC